ncbi:hypothetical protein BKA65DRAFT_290515 [Rhexocercosporidium sp. MPI-PUGE-AT-0058]|nr:hypothetical protein BKA65DRAFT_290515 [Rhexocercosporidium sp. MPI-PUGE-AT-0058]
MTRVLVCFPCSFMHLVSTASCFKLFLAIPIPLSLYRQIIQLLSWHLPYHSFSCSVLSTNSSVLHRGSWQVFLSEHTPYVTSNVIEPIEAQCTQGP